MAGVTQETAVPEAAQPENPFGDAGRQVRVTVPVDFSRLHAELDASLPGTDVHAALRGPAAEGPVGPDNPAHLSWTPSALSEAAARRVIEAHDPSPDTTTHIGDAGLAQRLLHLREQMSEGSVLGNADLTSGLALLIEMVSPPTS